MLNLFSAFRHELVSTVLVSALLGVAMWPVKKVRKAYGEFTSKLDAISSELTEQRSNHLAHIQASNDKQVEILSKVAGILDAIHLDQRELFGRLDRK